jgi:hypothetical protein
VIPPAIAAAAEPPRPQGARLFEQTIAQLGQRADNLDERWRGFKANCYLGRVAGSFDRDWYAIFDQAAMQGTVAPGCGPAFADIRRIAREIRDGVAAADETARQANVLPGARRDVLERYRLDYAGWGR